MGHRNYGFEFGKEAEFTDIGWTEIVYLFDYEQIISKSGLWKLSDTKWRKSWIWSSVSKDTLENF